MSKDNKQNHNFSPEEWAKRFDSPQQGRGLNVVNNLFNIFELNQNPNFYNNVQGAAGLTQNDYIQQFPGNLFPNQPGQQGGGGAWNWGDANKEQVTRTPEENQFIFQNLDPNVKDNYKSPDINVNNATQGTQFGNQYVNQDPATDRSPLYPNQDQGTPTNTENQTGQNTEYVNNSVPAQLQLNPAEHFSENFPAAELGQPIPKVTHEEALFNIEKEMNNNKVFLLQAVLTFIDHAQEAIKTQRETDKEADISKNAQQLFNRTKELFYYYSTAAELEQNATKKTEWTKKAAEQLKAIQANPLYSREINNEQEKRDACERAGRFIGETTSRIVGLGLGFGAAVAVASLMIPPAMVLYGPMIVAGPVVVAGAGGAAAFMANKLGYKIADITLSNTTALAGRLLDWSKNSLRDWWNKDKEQVKALTTLKNKLLQDIETAQLGFITAKNELNTAKALGSEKSQELRDQMTAHLENLYINTSVLTDLETSIVGQRQAQQKQKEALEEWKKTSLLNKAAKKIGESETWKSISETNASNICKKLGIITGKIVGLAVAAGLGAAAAIAITSSIGAAATILYGPMAVVGITAAAGIAAGAVGYKVANPVATWSFKKVGQVADLAKNATYDVGKFMAVGTKNIVMGKGKHSSKEHVKKDASQNKGTSK